MRHLVAFAGSLFLAAGLFTAPALAAEARGDAAHGKAAFARVCYSCHGYEGQGGSTGPKLAPGPLAYPAFSTFVRNTSGAMPPFTERSVSDQDLRDIHAYLASIPPSPNPSTIPLLQ
jgi:ubiquinol-cytochrome c reductase cytochrome c subunit